MAELTIEDRELMLRLSLVEKAGAFHGDVRMPVAAIQTASVAPDPWDVLRGHRAPGTGFPGLIKLGTMRGGFGKDFAAVYGRRPAVVIDLERHSFQRLIVCTANPVQDAASIGHATSAG